MGSMKRNFIVGRSLGLEKKENAVRSVMEQQKISVDPSRLAGYKKEKFLKAIDNQIGLGYYDKKAFHAAYDQRKTEISKSKSQFGLEKSKYDEIIAKRRVPMQDLLKKPVFVPGLVRDNGKLRNASGLVNVVGSETPRYDSKIESSNGNIRSRLKDIQG